MIDVYCDTCGTLFKKKSTEIKRTKRNFCSYECHHKWQKKIAEKAITKACLFCEKEFAPKNKKSRFCSQSCAASFNNKAFPKRIKIEKENTLENLRNKKLALFLNGRCGDKQVRGCKIIKRYLMERQEGKCAICFCEPFHNGKPLNFVVDHIDGIFTNNQPENIRMICPNCNSQTDTFSGKNRGRNTSKRHE